MSDDYTCARCKQHVDLSHTRVAGYCGGAGYAFSNSHNGMICYPCAAENLKGHMDAHGNGVLYLCKDEGGYYARDWGGHLSFRVHDWSKSKNNMGAERIDAWFFDGYQKLWHGINLGDNDILRCKRLKRQPS